MSSRVQKGGLVFKPVVKSRPRTVPSASRQASVLETNNTNISTEYDASPEGIDPTSVTMAALCTDTGQGRVSTTISSPVQRGGLVFKPVAKSRPHTVPSASRQASVLEINNTGISTEYNASPEDIDPTSVTMAALCTDIGHGRVSSKAAEILANHAAWKAKNKEKRAHMRNLMELKKYGREEESEHDQEGVQAQPVGDAASTSTHGTSDAPATAPILDSGNGFDYSQGLATSRYNVQVRIGPNGETVIDEESLVVDRVENDGTDGYTHVIESDHTKFVNSGTYGKRYRSSRWSAEETERFFDALSQYGENYELIAYVLPGRDRKSCKNKFKVEDKKNRARIDHCLNNSIPVDMVTLTRMTGKDFSGPVPEIRAPPPPIPIVAPSQEDIDSQTDVTQQQAKKRSRSKSQPGVEDGVIVVGDADTFPN